MTIINFKYHFNAAHKLYNPLWTEEKNVSVFGPCANENWHGHNFELIVKVKGVPNSETGFIINPQALNSLIQKEIIAKVDHKNLNLDVPFMKGKMASCENLVVAFWSILKDKIQLIEPNSSLYQIRLFETPRNFVDYYGD